MSDPARRDLTEGWPADPENEALARFAEELQAGLPALPPEAMAKVKRRVHNELGRRARRRWRLRLAGMGLAAALLLSVGGYVWLRPGPEEPTPAPVDDHYTVELAAPQTPLPPQPPLVRLEEN